MHSRIPSFLFAIALLGWAGFGSADAASFEIIDGGPDVDVFLRIPVPNDVKLVPGKINPDWLYELTDENGKQRYGQIVYANIDRSQRELIFIRPSGFGTRIKVGRGALHTGENRNRIRVEDGKTVTFGFSTFGPFKKHMLARYQLGVRSLPGHPKYDNANFFHPLVSPMGVTVSDDGPDDHLHHRGLFLSFKKFSWKGDGKTLSTDFWHPHKHEGTKIGPGTLHDAHAGGICSTLAASHEYSIDGQVVLTQAVVARATNFHRLNVLDLVYVITAKNGDVTLGKNFYSCLQFRGARAFKREELVFTYADGKQHDDVDAHKEDPPYDRWFDQTGKVDGKIAGATMIMHPSTPKSRLCMARGVKGLNANFLFDAPMKIAKDQTIRCKYQILIHDGTVAEAGIAPVAEWYNPGFQVKWSK